MYEDEVIPLPTCGRIVHYNAFNGETYAAIVSHDSTDESDKLRVDLTVFFPDETLSIRNVPYASAEHHVLASWHWMAYQLGQAKFGSKPGT